MVGGNDSVKYVENEGDVDTVAHLHSISMAP